MPDTRERIRLDFGILGPLRIALDGEERSLEGAKLRGLVALLLLDANRPVSAERLVDDLWGDEPPATARQSLHVHVARVRRALAVDGWSESLLETTPRGYVLRVEDECLDAARFRQRVAAARHARSAGDSAGAVEAYGRALELWRGDALEDVSLPSLELARAELEALRLSALEEQIDIALELGRAPALVAELEELVARYPFRERLTAQLMVALYATGRQADALEAYQDARRELDSLGLVPGPLLREVEQAVLRQDPALVTAPLPLAHSESAALVPPRRSRSPIGVALAAAALLTAFGIVFLLRNDPPDAAPVASVRVKPNSLVSIDPSTNRVTTVIGVGKGPESMSFTRNAAWVATGDRTIDRVDLRTREVRPLGGVPVALATAATLNDDVWVSSFEEPFVTLIARHGRVLEGGHTFASGPPRVHVPGSAEALAVGGGYLWVTSPRDSGGRDTVSRIDLRTRRLVSSTPVGSLPLYAAFGYGSAWIANYRGDSVSIVRPGSEQAETVAVRGGPLGVTTGAGAVWVVAFWSNEVVRVDPETRRVEHRIPVGAGPLAVAVGGGAVWVTNRDSKSISRIDPSSNRVIATISLAAAPYGIQFAHGHIWVTTQRCGSPIVACS